LAALLLGLVSEHLGVRHPAADVRFAYRIQISGESARVIGIAQERGVCDPQQAMSIKALGLNPSRADVSTLLRTSASSIQPVTDPRSFPDIKTASARRAMLCARSNEGIAK
jgi:hypothetical protein